MTKHRTRPFSQATFVTLHGIEVDEIHSTGRNIRTGAVRNLGPMEIVCARADTGKWRKEAAVRLLNNEGYMVTARLFRVNLHRFKEKFGLTKEKQEDR